LLLRAVRRSKKFPRKSALKVVDFALAGNEENCKYFVDILGLRTLFAAFMKKGAKKGRSGFNELADDGT
jgi:beta-catenin-like protein 1